MKEYILVTESTDSTADNNLFYIITPLALFFIFFVTAMIVMTLSSETDTEEIREHRDSKHRRTFKG